MMHLATGARARRRPPLAQCRANASLRGSMQAGVRPSRTTRRPQILRFPLSVGETLRRMATATLGPRGGRYLPRDSIVHPGWLIMLIITGAAQPNWCLRAPKEGTLRLYLQSAPAPAPAPAPAAAPTIPFHSGCHSFFLSSSPVLSFLRRDTFIPAQPVWHEGAA